MGSSFIIINIDKNLKLTNENEQLLNLIKYFEYYINSDSFDILKKIYFLYIKIFNKSEKLTVIPNFIKNNENFNIISNKTNYKIINI